MYLLNHYRLSLSVAGVIGVSFMAALGFVPPQKISRPPSSPVETKVVATLAVTNTVAPVTTAALPETNGNKVVGAGGALHAVFTDGPNIKYSTTNDGVTWSTPVVIAAIANHPTIAVAGTTIGVAYATPNPSFTADTIKYIYKSQSSSTWSTPVSIWSTGNSAWPSLVGYDSKMYLTWKADEHVKYVTFSPVLTTSPIGSSIENVTQTFACGPYSRTVYQTAIAVVPTSSTNSQPLIRVAYFADFIVPAGSTCGVSTDSFGLTITERHPSYWNEEYRHAGIPTSFSDLALSLAANPANGDYYVGTSYTVGVDRTELFYENAWNITDTWRSFTLLYRKAQIDVEAACGKFRVAVADVTQGSGGFGPTWYRTGTWTGKTVFSPTWDEPAQVPVSNFGANPQALFLATHTGTIINGMSHVISTIFDEKVGLNYSVKHDDRTFKGPSMVTPCLGSKVSTGSGIKGF